MKFNSKFPISMFCGLVTSLFATLLPCVARAACPDPKLDEKQTDCPWADIARATEFKTALNQLAPSILTQLKSDQATTGLLQLWGASRNADESKLTVPIVKPAILKTISDELKMNAIDPQFKVGHAGLIHTYGYLFSVLQTSYGYKRARYVEGNIERGFLITEGLFSGTPTEGTLLSNFSYFLARLALPAAPDFIPASKELREFNYSQLTRKRLIETVIRNGSPIYFYTDLVPYLKPAADRYKENVYLLIYSIQEPGLPQKLITAFPVNQKMDDDLFDPKLMGTSVTVKAKYNARLETDLSFENATGTRFKFEPQGK